METNNDEFTHDELIEALQQAQSDISDDPNFYTAPQLAAMLGISTKAVRKRLKALIAAGAVIPDRGMRYDYLGGLSSVKGVRWVGEKQ